MITMNVAQQIHFVLGVHNPTHPQTRYRLATAERHMRKGEDGQRKPGGYGRGLRNWINGKQMKARHG